MLPLWSERVIVAFPEHHALGRNPRMRWADLANEKFLVPQQGPGQELEGLLAAKLRHAVGSQRIVHQDVSLDRLLSLVSANYGALLMFEGATGVRYEGVVYHEVWDDDGPTRVPFMAFLAGREQQSRAAIVPGDAARTLSGLSRPSRPDLSAPIATRLGEGAIGRHESLDHRHDQLRRLGRRLARSSGRAPAA